jgi:hypothetical protein
MATRSLEIVFLGNPKPLQGAMQAVEDSSGKLHAKVSGLSGAFSHVASTAAGFLSANIIGKAPGFLMDAAKAAAEDEASTARLGATVRSLGGDYDAQMKKVNAAIKANQALGFTDDETRDSFSKLAQATGNTEEALKRQTLAMDLARGANIPLADASKLLGKITDENLQVFKKMGITLPDVANEADVLAAVQGKFAGQSDAYAKSTAGQFAILQDRLSEVQETIGATLLPIMAKVGDVFATVVVPKLEQFANWWQASAQPKIESFFAWLGPKLAEFADWFQVKAIPQLQRFADWAQVKFAEFAEYYQQNIQPALENLVELFKIVVKWVYDHWGEIYAVIGPVLEQVKTDVSATFKVIADVLAIVVALLTGDWAGAWSGAQQVVADWWEAVKATVGNLIPLLEGLVGAVATVAVAIGKSIFDGILSIDFWDLGSQVIHWIVQGLSDMAWTVIKKAEEIAGQIGEALNPRNWIGSPQGIQNWYPYYMAQGLDNLLAVVEGSESLDRAAGMISTRLLDSARSLGTLGGLPRNQGVVPPVAGGMTSGFPLSPGGAPSGLPPVAGGMTSGFPISPGGAPSGLPPVAGGMTSGFPDVLGFAGGTDFAPGGAALVGEAGPEMVILPRGSSVRPAGETNQLMRAGGRVVNEIHFHISGYIQDFDELLRMADERLKGSGQPGLFNAR